MKAFSVSLELVIEGETEWEAAKRFCIEVTKGHFVFNSLVVVEVDETEEEGCRTIL